jgi:2-polyprenyl-3-methyl-5-hydroxy-6-metoxy-1,4-benzoquinol methylase
MGNHRWMSQALRSTRSAGERILEIGAGRGELCRKLAAGGLVVDGLDRAPQPAVWPAGAVWHQADIREFDGYSRYHAVIANLVLHHLTDAELVQVGRRLSRGPRVVCICEPARRRRSQQLFSILGPVFGANFVTRHDARVSIAAGFLGDELPEILGLEKADWNVRSFEAPVGAYRMIAVRRA